MAQVVCTVFHASFNCYNSKNNNDAVEALISLVVSFSLFTRLSLHFILFDCPFFGKSDSRIAMAESLVSTFFVESSLSHK